MNYGKREMGNGKRVTDRGVAFPVSRFPFPGAGGSI
jgi:hypothetical protein